MALCLSATRFCLFGTNIIGKKCFKNPPNLYWKQVYDLKTSFFKRLQHNVISNCHKTSSKHTIQWIIAGGGILTTKLLFLPIAKCESVAKIEQSTELSISDNLAVETIKTSFPWIQFLSLLWPHIVSLSIAIVSAMGVAVLNTKIGIGIGCLVNILSANLPTSSGVNEAAGNFMNQIKEPVRDIIKYYVSHAVLTFTYIYTLAKVGENVAAAMRKDLFASILKQDIEFFDNHKSGEIVSRLTSDVQEFKSSFKHVVSQGLRCLTQTIGSSLALYQISPNLSGIMFFVVPSVIFIGTSIGSILRKLSKMAQAQTAKAVEVGEEAISNIRTVRSFAMEEMEIERYGNEVDKAQKLNEWLGMGIGLFQAGTVLFLNGIVLSTLYYGGYLLTAQELTPGDLMAFLVSTQTIQRSLGQMSLLFGQFVRGMSAGARVYEYINLEGNIPIKGGKIIPFHNLIGDVGFHNVTFKYPTRPEQTILNQLNLHVPGGKIVALVGASGGGKSTIAALLERFYDVNGGAITVDRANIKSLDPEWLRGRCIGFINQEPVLFASSILENIRYGRPEASDFEVYEAAEAANAHAFIQKFPNGYQTIVGERGVTVSGGQKQRIAIARALLKNPSILILDEATSALDAESEKIVQEALDNVCKGRTVLVIAHRLSTIKNADMIAVIADGKVAELGTHSQLKKLGGIYSQLIRQQEQEN